MAFTQDQVNQAYRDSLAQGFNASDIATGAGNLGIDPYMLQLAATASQPAPPGIPQGTNPAYVSGYGGYQPEGSKYWGDNPMPEQYMQQLPQINARNGQFVQQALDQALAQSRANGYGDSGTWIDRLRGYQGGTPQQQAEALQAASTLLGLNLSADYGQWRLDGTPGTIGGGTPRAPGGGTASAGGGGGAYGGQQSGGVNLQAYQKNPYLDDMAQGIRRQVNNNLTDTVLPGIRSNAVASGGFGGSRQGVAEGVAMGRASDSLAGALANLYGSDYQAQMGRNLQQYGMDQSYALGNKQADNSYNLGMGNLGLGYANLDRNINNDNNSWALQGANLLNSTWNQLNSNNAGAIGAGGNIQNTPINYWQQFGNQATAFGQGYGTSTQSGGGGNPVLGAAGGWQLGGQLGNMFGGNSGYKPDAMGQGMANNQSWYNKQIGF